MLLRCRAEQPSPAQRQLLGGEFLAGQEYHLVLGHEYVALGIEVWRGVVWVDIAENDRTVVPVPLFLFHVVDASVSQYWVARLDEDDHLTLWPQLFYERAFHDRLSNGERGLMQAFASLRREIEAEAR